MNEVIVFGDSGNKESALVAYRTACKYSLEEAYLLVKNNAIEILKNNFPLSTELVSAKLLKNITLEKVESVYQSLKKQLQVAAYYYEQSNVEKVRLFRCFISRSLDETVLQKLSTQLARAYCQRLNHYHQLTFKERA
ncbi:MAG: hypothetical protein R3240_07445 [Gammaproteobacteria bacterium]|nr:hypothetical protein [Gammaproteobacteria bacterium]